MFRSLRTTLMTAFGVSSLIALALMLALGVSLTRTAYQNLALRDVEFMTEQLVRNLDPIAARSKDAADFAQQAASETQFVQDQYFKRAGMTGYAVIQSTDGIVLVHPKLKFGSVTSSTPAGADLVKQEQSVSFNGTFFYQWQNQGEPKPRDKFMVVRKLPSHPEWAVMITAYTTDDLLLPFKPIERELAGIAAVILLATLVSGWLFSRGMLQAIRPLTAAITRIAGGDLQSAQGELTVTLRRRDELGQMARAYERMAVTMRELVRSLMDSARSVTETSTELSTAAAQAARASTEAARGADQVAAGASEQAKATGEVNGTMDELQSTIRQIADGAQTTAGEVQMVADLLNRMTSDLSRVADGAGAMARSAVQAAEAARQGAGVVDGTVRGIGLAKEATHATALRIKELEERVTRVGEISDLISGIADQTNLLALNAAIEAARAGELGRGFAVVAEEVRKLAERAASSTREISQLISDIQSRTAGAVQATETATTEVEAGSRSAAAAGEALKQILQIAEQTSGGAKAISDDAKMVRDHAGQVVQAFESVAAVTEENTAATEEMSAGVMQITHSAGQVAAVSQENAATAEQVSSAMAEVSAVAEQVAHSVQQLARVASDLHRQIGMFKV